MDGLFVAPLTVADELARIGTLQVPESVTSTAREQAERETLAWLDIKGQRTPRDFHRELGSILRDQVGVKRDEEGLRKALGSIRQLRDEFQSNLNVPGDADNLNHLLEMAGRTRDFLELGELMTTDALYRQESCGSHFRADLPSGRNDENFAHVAAWKWTGNPSEAKLYKEELEFETIAPAKRSY